LALDAFEIELGDWRTPFLVEYLLHGYLPLDNSERLQIRKRPINYMCINVTLYRRSYNGILLSCLDGNEIIDALDEVHATIVACTNSPKLHYQLKHLCYYWPTMFDVSMKFAKKCHQCQIHADFIDQPHKPIHPTKMSWPLKMWGMGIVGPIHTPSSKGHKFILAMTDYFSKWSEVIGLKEVKTKNVEDFIRNNLIYHFGVTSQIISDNGTSFKNRHLEKFFTKFKIKHHFFEAFNISMNCQAEVLIKYFANCLRKWFLKIRSNVMKSC
jgi:hypothetical protein